MLKGRTLDTPAQSLNTSTLPFHTVNALVDTAAPAPPTTPLKSSTPATPLTMSSPSTTPLKTSIPPAISSMKTLTPMPLVKPPHAPATVSKAPILPTTSSIILAPPTMLSKSPVPPTTPLQTQAPPTTPLKVFIPPGLPSTPTSFLKSPEPRTRSTPSDIVDSANVPLGGSDPCDMAEPYDANADASRDEQGSNMDGDSSLVVDEEQNVEDLIDDDDGWMDPIDDEVETTTGTIPTPKAILTAETTTETIPANQTPHRQKVIKSDAPTALKSPPKTRSKRVKQLANPEPRRSKRKAEASLESEGVRSGRGSKRCR